MSTKRRIIRHTGNSKIAGVCGAIAEYLGINARWIRIVLLVLTVLTFILPSVLLYLMLMLLIPKKNEETTSHVE